jgi:hypothetical protein
VETITLSGSWTVLDRREDSVADKWFVDRRGAVLYFQAVLPSFRLELQSSRGVAGWRI